MDWRDQEALSGLTDGAAHLLASTLLNQLGLSCLFVPPARTPHGGAPHEVVLPGQLLRYDECFLFSVGVRNHWLGVIPRGLFDPTSHYLYLPGHP